LGFSDWLGGTKCAECGQKIQGPRVARTVMGASVWVCGACDEKQKEQRRLDTERSAAESAERRQENEAERQKRVAEAAAAIGQRSDVDIAAAMSTITLREYDGFFKEVQPLCGNAEFNHHAAFLYFLSIATYAFRKSLGVQLDSARLDRIDETAARYALAGFIHGMFRKIPGFVQTEPIREKLLSKVTENYGKVCEVHRKNVERLWELQAEKNEKGVFAYFLRPAVEWFGQSFADAPVEVKTRMSQAVGKALFKALAVGDSLQQQLATLGSFVNREIDFPAPESWILRHERPFTYYDPASPQYRLLVSPGVPVAGSEAPEALVRRILVAVAPEAVCVPLGSDRAIAHYKTAVAENGQPKEDHHWVFAESREGGGVLQALFTLSVVEDRADSSTTEALVVSLGERIQQARFLV